MAGGHRIGVDLGGSKIEAALLDGAGAIVLRQRIATPAGDYKGTVAALTGLVAAIEREAGIAATVGVGIPGTVVAGSGLIKNDNS
ncbi:MAG: ROK family protein, partial [Stellaceae bacterium]